MVRKIYFQFLVARDSAHSLAVILILFNHSLVFFNCTCADVVGSLICSIVLSYFLERELIALLHCAVAVMRFFVP